MLRSPLRSLFFYLWLALASLSSLAQEKAIVFRGAHIIPIVGQEIPNGVLVVKDGRILALGSKEQVEIPAGAEIREVNGILMPGLVDSHSHLGGGSGGDRSHPIQPDCRIWETINARDTGFQKAQAGGLTTVNVMPGSGHLLSGQTIYLKIRDARHIEEMLIRDKSGWIMGGMKMANGTNSIREAPFPGTRGKSAAMVRKEYIKAIEYRDKIKRAASDPEKMPARDLRLEGLVEVLDKKRIVHHHTHRHDDILTVLRLAREFDFRVVLHHVSEGWKIAKEIAAAKVPCSIIVIDSPGGKLEAVDLRFETGGVLERAGVLTGFHTDDGITDSRLFFRSAALAIRAGMSRKGALEGLTIANAKMLDLEKKVGSLEVGKDADFILLDGDPFSVYTKVQQTWVEGRLVFDRSRPKDLLYAVGGYGASDGQIMHINCGWAGHDDDHGDDR
ncbi:MAG: amidohydrolase family protein [Planctomycetota bacterium]